MIGTLKMRMRIAEMGLLLGHLMWLLLGMSCVWLNRWLSCLITEGRTQSIESSNTWAISLGDLHLKLRNCHLPLMFWIMSRL